MANLKIDGIKQLSNNIKKLQNRADIYARRAIEESTTRTYEKVNTFVSNSPQTGVDASKKDNSYGGTGLEIPPLGTTGPVIGERTGRLKALLSKSTQSIGGIVSGEVGFPKGIESHSPSESSSNAVDWPNQPVNMGVQSPQTKPDELEYDPGDPTQYVSKVILGTDEIHGRNVLRLALLQDIVNGDTVLTLTRHLQGIFNKY